MFMLSFGLVEAVDWAKRGVDRVRGPARSYFTEDSAQSLGGGMPLVGIDQSAPVATSDGKDVEDKPVN